MITVAGQSVTVNQAAAGTPGPGGITFTSTSPLPAGAVGAPYSLNLGISGGVAPYSWTAAGTFPPGLGLGPTTGSVTGVPTTAGNFSFTITVTDATGASASQPFTMTITSGAAPGTFAITTASLPNASVGAAYQQSVNATGACSTNPFGGGGVNWTLASGTLPAGTESRSLGYFRNHQRNAHHGGHVEFRPSRIGHLRQVGYEEFHDRRDYDSRSDLDDRGARSHKFLGGLYRAEQR